MTPPRFPIKPSAVMVSTPCENCPFRKDVRPFLRPRRVIEIWHEARTRGTHFICHKTVVYGDNRPDTRHAKACAGFLLVARKDGSDQQLQIVQVAERLSGITGEHLRGTELVYDSPEDMIAAHTISGKPPK